MIILTQLSNSFMKKLILSLSAIILLMSSCAKDGETGPAGPAGADGNANVHSINLLVSHSEWEPGGMAVPPYYLEKDIPVPEITQSVYRYGTVIVYLDQAGAQTALPYTTPIYQGISWSYGVQVHAGGVKIKITQNDGAVFTVPSYYFKITVIEGN